LARRRHDVGQPLGSKQVSYTRPTGEIKFGDIFEADYLFDVFVRADSAAIPGYEVPAQLAEAFGKKVVGHPLPPQPFDLHSPAFPTRSGQDFVRAHGGKRRAVIMSDNCTIATAFGYDERSQAKKAGRLLFAPLVDASEKEIEAVVKQAGYGRFSFEPSGFFAGGVVELRRAFMVDLRAIQPEQRVARPDPDLAELLEVRWSAYAARRGPDVFNRNAHKLKSLLSRPGEPDADDEEAAARVADVLSVAWRLEGDSLEEAASAWDKDYDAEPAIAELIEGLRTLEQAAAAAAAKLEAYVGVP
jgi:hypothetical protein